MSLDENTLRAMYERSQQMNPDKMQFTSEESERFKKSFEDPEFRKLFAEYMDELQDPKNREETEAYISQLEGEQKVPEGKELIRPEPAFVAKSYKKVKGKESEQEKIFINIVQSSKIEVPSKTDTPQGTCWSVPYSLGPPHMEKDKNGSNTTCFDCCFHPDAIELSRVYKEFKDLLVNTAMEGVEQMYKQQRQEVTLDREFHVVKGVNYKSGQVPTMMISVANKENWKSKGDATSVEKPSAAPPVPGARAAKEAASSDLPVPPHSNQTAPAATTPATTAAAKSPVKPKSAPASGMKKGFLNSSKAELYGDKLTTIRKRDGASGTSGTGNAASSGISLVDQSENDSAAADSLRLPGTAAARKGKDAATTGLIQEVQPGQRTAVPSAALSSDATVPPKAPKEAGVVGLKAVSTTKRTAPSSAPVVDTRNAALHSPSGHRNVTATSPAGSDAADADFGHRDSPLLSSGLEVPKYTVKERGHVSMGDFTNMQTSAQSSRPAELVYRIELPKIAKASAIILDIAERQLNLSYPDVYSLVVKLPYPVQDTKGTAKYDKASKSLTVTLPVRPPAAVPLAAAAPQASSDGVTESDNPVTELPSDPARTNAPVKTTPAKKSSVGHGRWVSSPDGATAAPSITDGGDDAEPPLSLHEQIKRQAEAALAQAKAAAASAPAAPATKAPVEASKKAASAPADSEHHIDNTVDFIPAETFAGRKAGFAFKRGGEGVGYYRDLKQQQPGTKPEPVQPAAVAAAAAAAQGKAAPSEEYHLFPYECRQTKNAVAVIVQVPSIDASSVEVSFQPFAVHVAFKAFVDGDAPGKIESRRYGAVFSLPEAQCGPGLDVARCRYDVANQNMAIVLTKQAPKYWRGGSAGGAGAAQSTTTESKSGELDEDAMSLLRVEKYFRPAASDSAAPAQPMASSAAKPVATKAVDPEAAKTVKALESAMQALQFSSADALFELD